MSIFAKLQPKAASEIPEAPIARFFFADTRMAWLWLIVRLYVGYQWLGAGFAKLTGAALPLESPEKSWIFTSNVGASIKGFAQGAIAKANGPFPSVQGWYASFLKDFVVPYAGLWAYLITFGELLVGLGLIFGVLTGIASFFGLMMNFNYVLAGAVSTNPVLGFLALFLLLAWRTAGYWGGDRYLLPLLGVPWTGSLAKKEEHAKAA